MAMDKRLKEIIKSRWTLLLGSIALCTISIAFLVISMSSGNAIRNVIDDFMNTTHVEDASFMVQSSISENEISNLENTYNVSIEQTSYYDLEFQGQTLRIIEATETINQYLIKEGRDIENSQEILINENFAKSNNIKINNYLDIENEYLQVVGFFVRPDYATPIKNSSDTIIDENFGIIIANSKNIAIDSPISYYSIIYNENNITEFREMLYENYGLISYLARENNTRISTPSQIATGVTQMAYMFGPVLFLLTTIFCVIIIIKILKYDKSTIGILYSIGYQKRELLKFYLKIFYFISIISSILGITLGVLLSIPISQFYALMGNIPTIRFEYLINWKAMLLGVFVPAVILTLTGRIVIGKYLKQDVVTLLRNQPEVKKKNTRLTTIKSYTNIHVYSFRTLFRNKGRLLAFIFSVFLAIAIMLMGLIMKSSVTYIYEDKSQTNINYEYLYTLDNYYDDKLTDGEGIINLSWEVEETGNIINIMGIQPDTTYFALNSDGISADLTTGFHISNLLAKTLNLKVNDKINLINPVSLEKYKIEIQGIVEIDEQKAMYTSLQNLNELLGNKNDNYNSIVSNKELLNNEERIINTIKSTELLESLKSSLTNSVLSVVNVLVIIGITIGIVVIYMITSMTLEENESNITMLKILGYTDKEIIKMIFGGYKYLILLVYTISIPIILYFCEMQFLEEANSLNMLIRARIQPSSIVAGLLFIFVSYYTAIWISKKPISKVSMVDSLKKNRE